MNAFSVTLGNVLITLLYLSVVFLVCRSGLTRAGHTSSISSILLDICGPCMFIDALTSLDHSPSLTGSMFLFFCHFGYSGVGNGSHYVLWAENAMTSSGV